MAGLTEHQIEALMSYDRLLKSHPEIFTGRERRPIVRDPHVLRAFAEEHQVVLGVAAATPYLWLINDLVQGKDSAGNTLFFPYLREIAPPQPDADLPAGEGAVVLATMPSPDQETSEVVALVEQERHATGTLELELPRGFGEPGIPAADQALRELRQETGYRGEQAHFLGRTLPNSGGSGTLVSFFHVPITGQDAAEPEGAEAITQTILLSREEIWRRIIAGEVRDGFTVQALALYEHRLRPPGAPAERPRGSGPESSHHSKTNTN